MGSTKQEMKPSSDSDKKKVQTINAKDLAGKKKGGVFERWRNRNKNKKDPLQAPKNFAELLEEFDEYLQEAISPQADQDTVAILYDKTKQLLPTIELRLFDMIGNKRKELKEESGREEYNRRALGRLLAMDWHFQRIKERYVDEYSWGSMGLRNLEPLLDTIEWDLFEIVGLAEEYGADV